MSLSCALLATLLQQWARRYLWVTQPRCSPHRRARIRSFFAEGVDKLHLHWAVEVLPTLLHGSLLLFFSGLVIFLFNIHHTVFTFVLCWVGLCVGAYLCFPFTPIFRRDSPYYTPLSLSAWFLVNSLLYLLFKFLSWLEVFHIYSYDTWIRLVGFKGLYLRRLLRGLVKAAEETAQELGLEIDGRALMWTFEALDEDHELEYFFAAIPGFCNSKVVADPLGGFIKPNDKKLSAAVIEFMERTLSSNLISESVKQRRIIICRTAVDTALLSASQQILDRALLGTWDEQLHSIEFGLTARRWGNGGNPHIAFRAKCVVAVVLARVQERDDRWCSLALGQFGVSRSVLQRYLGHGDSVLLVNLICITREIFRFNLEHRSWPLSYGVSLRALTATSNFNAQHAFPELLHGFCDLWNQLVLISRGNKDHYTATAVHMLNRIRKIYVALHEGIDAAVATLPTSTNDDDCALNQQFLYPLCDAHSHVSALTPLDLVLRSLEAVTHATEEINGTPAISPQISPSALLALATATSHHSPSPSATLPSDPPISHYDTPPTTVPPPAIGELPSSRPAPMPRSMHPITLHTLPGSQMVPSSGVRLGLTSMPPTPIPSGSAPK